MKKLIIALTSAAMLIIASTASAATELKVGVVDFQKVNQQTNLVAQFRTAFNEKRTSMMLPVTNLQKLVQAERAKLSNKDAKVSAEQRTQIESKIKAQQAELTKAQTNIRQEMLNLRTNITEKYQDKINEVIGRIAKQQGLFMVLQKASVAYVENKVDITTPVIAALKKEFPQAAQSAAQQSQNPKDMMKKLIKQRQQRN